MQPILGQSNVHQCSPQQLKALASILSRPLISGEWMAPLTQHACMGEVEWFTDGVRPQQRVRVTNTFGRVQLIHSDFEAAFGVLGPLLAI